MAWDIVIAGGGFGGLLGMAPGTGRKLRLMADWTVGLLFGRDAPELGQLGHPPSLGGYLDTPALGGPDRARHAGPAGGSDASPEG